MFRQMKQRHLRRIAHAMKHRFAREKSANRHAINAARQFAVLPAFEAVRVPLFVQPRVGLDEFSGDPRIRPPRRARRAILDYHMRKRAIDGDFKSNVFCAGFFLRLSGTCKSPGSKIARGSGDHHEIRPRDRPRKNPAAVREQQPLYRHVPADRHSAPWNSPGGDPEIAANYQAQ